MSYVTLPQVQAWLNLTKFSLLPSHFDEEQANLAADKILGWLEQRYDTSTWTDDETTPRMVRTLIAMLTASFTLRKAVSEDDGVTTYCDWLEDRVYKIVEGLVDGGIDLPGVDPDPTAPASASAEFYPNNASTQLWKDEGDVEGASARWFTMQKVF